MFNPIAFTNFTSLTVTAVTLGYAPGQTTPPQLLVMNPSANGQVTLPPTSSQQIAPPTVGQTTVGTSGGYRITVLNASTFTISAAVAVGSDTIIGSTTALTSVNTKYTLQADPGNSVWWVVG